MTKMKAHEYDEGYGDDGQVSQEELEGCGEG